MCYNAINYKHFSFQLHKASQHHVITQSTAALPIYLNRGSHCAVCITTSLTHITKVISQKCLLSVVYICSFFNYDCYYFAYLCNKARPVSLSNVSIYKVYSREWVGEVLPSF